MKGSDIRQELRDLKVLEGPFDPVDFTDAGDNPQALFRDWLRHAIAAGVREPHAMTISTVDAEGCPDSRVLILKNLDDRGWHFAISAVSPKGRQVAENPAVALCFYWSETGRQVRIQGRAIALDDDERAADFRARTDDARANVLLERQSTKLDDPVEVASAMAESRARIAADPGLVSPAWQVYAVAPDRVEFWQAATNRLHDRLIFQRNPADGSWEKHRLWP